MANQKYQPQPFPNVPTPPNEPVPPSSIDDEKTAYSKRVAPQPFPIAPPLLPKKPIPPESPDSPQRQHIHNFEMGAGDHTINGDEEVGMWAGSAVQRVAPFQLGLDGSLSMRTLTQAAAPTTAQMRAGEITVWIDSGTSAIYLVVRQGGSIKKIQLS